MKNSNIAPEWIEPIYWNLFSESELVSLEFAEHEINEVDEKNFSHLVNLIHTIFTLETSTNDCLFYSPFKYSFFNLEELSKEPVTTCKEIALTIFKKPFSYFNQV